MPARATKPLLLCLALSGCVAGEAVMQETTRSLARSAVNSAAAKYVPGVDVSPYTNCIINNATTDELLQLAKSAGAGSAPAIAESAWPLIRVVAGRQDTVQCFVKTLPAAQLLPAQNLAVGLID